MRKLFLLSFIFLLCDVFAQEICQNDIDLRWENDTLYVTALSDSLPRFVVVSAEDGTTTYKQVVNDAIEDDWADEHPSDEIYSSLWTSARVNPYQVSVEKLNDSIPIDCSGFVMPYKGNITSHFGSRRYRYHFGTDIKLITGDSVYCAWTGQVRIVRYDPRGYGNFVVVRHRNGLETVYGHLSRVLVEENEYIQAGEVIGLGGNTGRSTGSHLHFEIRYLGNAINTEYLVDYEKFCMKDDQYLITKAQSFDYYKRLKEMQQAKYITVKSGDNLSLIAKRYGTTVNAICRLNGIKSTSVLKIGQRLRVR